MILSQGIGDTIRVSLTGDPLEEVKSAKIDSHVHWAFEKAVLRWFHVPPADGPSIDLIGLANQVENMVEDIPLDIKVAVMGCVVNGPG